MTAPTVTHQLTTTVIALAQGGYRIVATCTCLHFGRTAIVTDAEVAALGRVMVADLHAEHQLAARTGVLTIPDRPSWLPPLP